MATRDDLPVRADLVGKKPYGAPMLQVPYALNVNENTHPIPAHVRESIVQALARELETINRYPDREFTELREALASYSNSRGSSAAITPDMVWAANGSNEVLQHVLQAFGGPGRSLLGFPPTYSMHPIIAEATGTLWVEGARGADYSLSAESVVADIRSHQPDLVFFCAPNNPTGTPVPLEVIDATSGKPQLKQPLSRGDSSREGHVYLPPRARHRYGRRTRRSGCAEREGIAMTQEIAGSMMLALMVLSLGLALWGWRSRVKD